MIDDDNVGVADVSLGVGSSHLVFYSRGGQDTNPGLFDFNPATRKAETGRNPQEKPHLTLK
eukprot:scaffold62096_cov48-Cyclotella_meneghiniana.AAC.3